MRAAGYHVAPGGTENEKVQAAVSQQFIEHQGALHFGGEHLFCGFLRPSLNESAMIGASRRMNDPVNPAKAAFRQGDHFPHPLAIGRVGGRDQDLCSGPLDKLNLFYPATRFIASVMSRKPILPLTGGRHHRAPNENQSRLNGRGQEFRQCQTDPAESAGNQVNPVDFQPRSHSRRHLQMNSLEHFDPSVPRAVSDDGIRRLGRKLAEQLFDECLFTLGTRLWNNYINAATSHIGVFKRDDFTGAQYRGLFRIQRFPASHRVDVVQNDLNVHLLGDILLAQCAGQKKQTV